MHTKDIRNAFTIRMDDDSERESTLLCASDEDKKNWIKLIVDAHVEAEKRKGKKEITE